MDKIRAFFDAIHRPEYAYLAPFALLLGLWGAAFLYSSQKSFPSLLATFDLTRTDTWDSLLEGPQPMLDKQRAIQRHYLSYGVYIPLDDIVVNARQQLSEPASGLLPRVCGSGRIFVWIPLPMRIPFFGEKVIEWCLVKT